MSVSIEEIAVTNNAASPKTKAEKYNLSHLPFPSADRSERLMRWKTVYRATLIAWASTLGDPFGSGTVIDGAVNKIWVEVFPEYTSLLRDAETRKPIVSLVRFPTQHTHHTRTYNPRKLEVSITSG